MATARYYDESKNPEGAMLPGVPHRDLTDEDFDAYPRWLQNSIDAWDAYRKTNPNPTPRRTARAESADTTKDEEG